MRAPGRSPAGTALARPTGRGKISRVPGAPPCGAGARRPPRLQNPLAAARGRRRRGNGGSGGSGSGVPAVPAPGGPCRARGSRLPGVPAPGGPCRARGLSPGGQGAVLRLLPRHGCSRCRRRFSPPGTERTPAPPGVLRTSGQGRGEAAAAPGPGVLSLRGSHGPGAGRPQLAGGNRARRRLPPALGGLGVPDGAGRGKRGKLGENGAETGPFPTFSPPAGGLRCGSGGTGRCPVGAACSSGPCPACRQLPTGRRGPCLSPQAAGAAPVPSRGRTPRLWAGGSCQDPRETRGRHWLAAGPRVSQRQELPCPPWQPRVSGLSPSPPVRDPPWVPSWAPVTFPAGFGTDPLGSPLGGQWLQLGLWG
ncbi:uncharacterized protein J5F26_004640 [Ciconia maguari]